MRREAMPMKVYRNFETTDEADLAYYHSLTSAERIEIMFQLRNEEQDESRLDRTPRITKRQSS